MSLHYDCDGTARRDFLRLGMLGLGGLPLSRLAASPKNDKALIFLWLAGGHGQLDTYDMKPDAPAEIRGEFRPIPTSVPGVQICELLPHTAEVADKLCILRSMTSVDLGSHERSSRYLQTGVLPVPNMDFASFGAVYSKQKNFRGALPPFVGVLKPIERGYGGGFLGPQYDPFMAGDPSEKNYRVRDLLPPEGITLERLGRRREILDEFNKSWRHVETEAKLTGFDPAVGRGVTTVRALPLSPAIHSSSRFTSCAVCHRSSGSFARQVATSRSRPGGASGRTDEIAGGCAIITAEMRLA